jgi:dienelactone hydrolase
VVRPTPKSKKIFSLLIIVSLGSLFLSPAAAAKKPVNYDCYDSWRSIQGTRLSRDGQWLVYALVAQQGDGELVARNLRNGSEHRQPRGKDPVITADGLFVVFAISPRQEEVDKAKKDKKKTEEMPKAGMGILNLSTGEAFTAERVKSFKVPEDGGAFMAYLLEPPVKKPDVKPAEEKKEGENGPENKDKKKEKKKDPGSEFIVRNLVKGTQSSFSEVVEYSWTKDGSLLAYTVSSKAAENDGIFIRRSDDGSIRNLLTGQGNYKGLAFDEKGKQFAFVSDRDEYKSEVSRYRLYRWGNTDSAAAEVSLPIPESRSVSENGKVEFSKDNSRLYFGTAAVPPAESKDSPDPIKVDIWNYRDPELQTMQKVRAEDEKKRSYRAVYHLKEKRFVQLADQDVPQAAVVEEGVNALGSSNIPYRPLISWDGEYSDYYLITVTDGTKRKLIEKSRFSASLSPGGNYVLYFDHVGSRFFSVRASDGKKFDLTGSLKVSFQSETADTPEPPQPYGSAGWTEGDKSVLLYDRYDIWEIQPDGSGAHMVTSGFGRRNKIVFRYEKLDPDEKSIPYSKPLLLQAIDEGTKASGYFKTTLPGAGDPTKLVMLDKAFRGMIKAKNSDTVVFQLSRFEEFPDLWVSDLGLGSIKKVTNANPQQAEYNWGKAELIDYRNVDGKSLRGTLIKPEDFDPARKYPLMVYIYEELTDSLHRYYPPAPGTGINFTRYVSNGYVLLQPDIVYDIGYPGESAMKCVLPAIQKVVDQGYIATDRIGIMGHSWGGYQISYMITRTNMFRAVEAGASVVNMISAYGGIRWGSGLSRAFQYETSQSRIGAPPWLRPLAFIENSPIFWVEKVKTPYLTIANDEDDAVPWYQGIEFFTALRHLGKEAYMFNYNGEKHGLRERENQKHWTIHLDEFFDHHLRGAPLPEWMGKGVPYLERGKRDVSSFYNPAKANGK